MEENVTHFFSCDVLIVLERQVAVQSTKSYVLLIEVLTNWSTRLKHENIDPEDRE